MDNHYDVIIAGAGAAGAIIASRLTEDADRSVLVLDAGPDFPNLESLPEEIRYAYGRDRNLWDRAFGAGTMFGWGCRARATDHAPNIFVPRGKIVGGSSAVNAQIFLRGMPEDYDSWAQAGSDGWSHQDLLPFFCMNETDLDYGDKAYHGDAGPIRARRFKHAELNTEHRAFYAAARDAGYADCPDHNAPGTTGVGPLPLNNAEGIRWSTAIGYLNPARSRPNLTIQANTHVCRVLFDGKKATGLQVEQNGTPGGCAHLSATGPPCPAVQSPGRRLRLSCRVYRHYRPPTRPIRPVTVIGPAQRAAVPAGRIGVRSQGVRAPRGSCRQRIRSGTRLPRW